MSLFQEVTLYLIALSIFLVVDLTWLGFIAKERYFRALKKFLPKQFHKGRAFLFYAVFILGLVIMVLVPAVNHESLGIAIFRGLAYGFFTYSTYDLTNWSTVDKWPTAITFQDIAWGTFLSLVVSITTYSLYVGIFN